MTFQSFSQDETMLLILQNNLHKPFKPILQQEIINTKWENRKKQEHEMHVNNKWKEENKMIRNGYEAPGISNLKETQSPMKETKI